MKTLSQFIKQHGITATAERRSFNPNAPGFGPGSHHWVVTLARPGATLAVPFSQGSALTETPTAADVLDCLADDSAGYENTEGIADWCREYGFDPDEGQKKSARVYRTVEKQARALLHFLGSSEVYEALLFDTERD